MHTTVKHRRWTGSLGIVAALTTLVVIGILRTIFLPLLREHRAIHPLHASSSLKSASARANPQKTFQMTDTNGDGTPDGMLLRDPADQDAFRRWFTGIAEAQALRPQSQLPAEINDCASLLRFSYREALKRHDAGWFVDAGYELPLIPGEIHAWHYPETPLGAGLFRVRPGAFVPGDEANGAFAQFADAKTLIERNSFRVSRDVRAALPGDLLFYRQFGQSSPWHSMIVAAAGRDARVVYHTGPDHAAQSQPASKGELRRVLLSELLEHPQPQWRPTVDNPNFLGVYRWNILRGNQ